MPMTVLLLLALAAFLCTIASALNYTPLWIAVLLVCVMELLRVMPMGH